MDWFMMRLRYETVLASEDFAQRANFNCNMTVYRGLGQVILKRPRGEWSLCCYLFLVYSTR
jgi:hypothetical protein